MHILVTGAAGFVGYAVAARLTADGHDVTGMTRSPRAALRSSISGHRFAHRIPRARRCNV